MSRMKLEYTIDDIREVEQDAYERGRRDALEEKQGEWIPVTDRLCQMIYDARLEYKRMKGTKNE